MTETFYRWTAADADMANMEGWFLDEDEYGEFRIQQDFNSGVFTHDDVAYDYVLRRANSGSFLHQKALTLIEEYESFNDPAEVLDAECEAVATPQGKAVTSVALDELHDLTWEQCEDLIGKRCEKGLIMGVTRERAGLAVGIHLVISVTGEPCIYHRVGS